MIRLCDDLINVFNNDFLELQSSVTLPFLPKTVDVRRNDDLTIELTFHCDEWPTFEGPDVPPGTLSQSAERIEFTSGHGDTYVASGAIYRGNSSRFSAEKGPETAHRYTIRTLTMQSRSPELPYYIIESVANLSDTCLGETHLKSEELQSATISIGRGSAAVEIKRSNTLRGFTRIVSLHIDGVDIHLVHDKKSKTFADQRDGYVIYKQNLNSADRKKIRSCLSFIFGLPIILLGEAIYDNNGKILSMKSISPYTYQGAAFRIFQQPPYPVCSGEFRNLIDTAATENAIVALLRNYEKLDLNNMFWIYWHGMLAALPMASVYFASAIEHLQRRVQKNLRTDTSLLKEQEWSRLRRDLLAILDQSSLEPNTKRVISNKISALNQLPQSVAFQRLLKRFGLDVSDVELSAWKGRNSAAHGGIPEDTNFAILNNKLLRIMVHRVLGAATSCNDMYIDYYNVHFPARSMAESVPARDNSR